MVKINKITTLLSLMLMGQSYAAFAQDITITDKTINEKGEVTFLAGELGLVNAGKTITAVKQVIASEASYAANGNEDFSIKRQWVDELGKLHTHLNQTINGLKVYGTSLIAHATVPTASSTASVANAGSQLFALSGTLAVAAEQSVLSLQSMSQVQSTARINQLVAEMGEVTSSAELVYVYLPLSKETKLAWKIDVKYQGINGFEHDSVFFDFSTLSEIARHAKVHSAKQYNTYTHNNRPYNDSSQRQLLCSTSQSCADAAAQRAHTGASVVYDYYKNKHNRNGINNSDLVMNSNVHVGSNWNNAVWYNNQMFYGEGDGSQFTDFTLSFDIIGHELTHGVTEYTAGLIYQNASGALNEAWSDILGVSADAYKRGSSQPIWKLGQGSYTPGTPGDGLRYMNNPTQDGYSTDYYPERIPFTNNPTDQNDRGGVHGNSGIANLAYTLLVDGGKHPRNKTTATVPAIGLAKAEKIFYRALTTYFTQSTDFAAARTGTAQAAQDLYGTAEKTAVETAWCAVGVGSCPTGGTTPPPTGTTVLVNGTPKTGLSAATNAELLFSFEVPAGATNIKVATSGGTGDSDLYVKFGSAANDGSFDCRPYENGNAESCTLTSTGGTYYVRLKAYAAFSGVTLTGSYTSGGTGSVQPISETVNNVSVAQGAWTRYTYDLPAGYANMTIAISGGTGDADMYVRFGAQSTTSQYDCRPFKNGNTESCSFSAPKAGTWYIDLSGYATASGVTLTLKANP
ncbi:M4 family metallopeptidase [Pseudoalteromonas tunicata]|uniref:M4 family metallopeptidase n=1 Tax=Pseudoalteromonas tunicata TaxID=314281 RepID=UPI0027400AC6|nr:M4 family metallopeptidase [Pseudoalteromonas tunicata]MDP5212595.1 M4 family metallopeptidase [Pseudoalteromonas tunicata]